MTDGKLVTTPPARKPDNETPVTLKSPAPSQHKSQQVAAKDRSVVTNEPEQKPRRKHKKSDYVISAIKASTKTTHEAASAV